MISKFHLLPIAALLLMVCQDSSRAETPNTPNTPAVSLGVEIKSFTVDVAGAIRGGQVIHVSLIGSPGGKATFAIPNVIEMTPMKETSPGLYQGQYVTNGGSPVIDGKVIGQLTAKDGTMAPLFSCEQSISIDANPPKLVHPLPADDEIVIGDRPVLFCGFDDGAGTGINPRTLKLQLDGVDVESTAAVSPFGITYQPPAALSVGVHAIFVSVADQSGNRTQNIWHFTIAKPQNPPTFTSDKPEGLLAGDKMTVTLLADSGLKPSFRVEPLNQTFQLSEVQPGRYRGIFTPRPGDSVGTAPVVARFGENGAHYVITLASAIQISAGNPIKPVFTPQSEDDSPHDGLEIRGRALAYDRVVYKINYTGRGLSGEFPFTGTALVATATADAHGEWHVGPFKLALLSLTGKNLDTRLSMEAYTVDAEGNESFPTTDRIDMGP